MAHQAPRFVHLLGEIKSQDRTGENEHLVEELILPYIFNS